ncbi:MAG: DsbA family protein, partial [Anaerolineae bacterium]|nr:DsbA family protein [Anaerolineae bacterium]
MMVKRMLWILAALFIFPYTVTAQADAVVYAVLFYSPTCPHCHQVIENDLPPLQEKYGDQLQILFINVTVQGGRE